jgi:hypothetical protein
MRLRLPGCNKGHRSNQQPEADQTRRGNSPRSLSNETTQAAADHRVKTLSNQVRNKAIGIDDESRKKLFPNSGHSRVCDIGSHNRENDASDVCMQHILPIEGLNETIGRGQCNIFRRRDSLSEDVSASCG